MPLRTRARLHCGFSNSHHRGNRDHEHEIHEEQQHARLDFGRAMGESPPLAPRHPRPASPTIGHGLGHYGRRSPESVRKDARVPATVEHSVRAPKCDPGFESPGARLECLSPPVSAASTILKCDVSSSSAQVVQGGVGRSDKDAECEREHRLRPISRFARGGSPRGRQYNALRARKGVMNHPCAVAFTSFLASRLRSCAARSRPKSGLMIA